MIKKILGWFKKKPDEIDSTDVVMAMKAREFNRKMDKQIEQMLLHPQPIIEAAQKWADEMAGVERLREKRRKEDELAAQLRKAENDEIYRKLAESYTTPQIFDTGSIDYSGSTDYTSSSDTGMNDSASTSDWSGGGGDFSGGGASGSWND